MFVSSSGVGSIVYSAIFVVWVFHFLFISFVFLPRFVFRGCRMFVLCVVVLAFVPILYCCADFACFACFMCLCSDWVLVLILSSFYILYLVVLFLLSLIFPSFLLCYFSFLFLPFSIFSLGYLLYCLCILGLFSILHLLIYVSFMP